METARALLIEDNEADRVRIARELRSAQPPSFDLTMVGSLQSGLDHLSTNNFDVILLDLSLPDAHGLVAVQRITAHCPELAVVVLTGLDDRETAISALQQGAQDYLSKDKIDGRLLVRSLQYAIERKRISSDLRHSEQRYRALVSAMTSIVWSTDARGEIQNAQPAWSRYTGQVLDEYSGFGWIEAIHQDQQKEAKEFCRSAIKSSEACEFSWRVWHADSQHHRHCVVRVVPIISSEQSASEWVGTLTDVEDARQAEELLHRTERLASLGTLAAGIAHEINNPIVAAWSSAQAALNVIDQPIETELLVECLQNVIRSVERCRDTVDGVLQFARHGNVDRQRCDICRIVECAVDEVAHYADMHDQSLNLLQSGEGSYVYGNEAQLQQILVTIVRNAIEAGVSGDHVQVNLNTGREHVEICVKDVGRGMTVNEQQKAFDPFFTSRKIDGTGLGLSIAHGIVESHGGTIELESDEGIGTTVLLRFPLVGEVATSKGC